MANSDDNVRKVPGRPFLPGQSGNKGGRPRDIDGIRDLVREQGTPLVERLIRIALGTETRKTVTALGVEVDVTPTLGESTKAAEVLLSYWVGKPQQSIDLQVATADVLGIAEVRAAARELLKDKDSRVALRDAIRGGASNSSTIDYETISVVDDVKSKPVALPTWFSNVLSQYARVAIAGGPKTGKTTLSAESGTRTVFHGDDHIGNDWSENSAVLAKLVNEHSGPCVVEGVQVPRALRKGMRVDVVIWLGSPCAPLTKQQQTMTKGVATVFDEWRAANPSVPVLVPPA